MVSIVHRSVEIPVTPWIQMDPPQLDEANESPSSCWLDAPGVLVPTGYSSQRAGNTPGINHPNRPWLDCRVLHRCRTAFAHWMAVGRKGRITSRLWPLLKQTSISWVPLWHERVEKNAGKKDGIHGTWVNKPWKKIHPEFHLGGISLTWYLHFQPQGSGPRSQLLMKPLKAFAHWRPPNNRIAVDGHGHRLRNNGNAPTALGLTVSTARTVGGCCLQGVFFRFG